MKVNNYTGYNTGFKAFIVSYNTAETLKKLPNGILSDILRTGNKMEATEYIDLELLSDLKFRIREKTNHFSGMTEPFSVYKPKGNEKRIKISGIYNGINDETHKCGKMCSTYIGYSSHEEAVKGYSLIKNSETKIQRIGNIAKEMDKQKIQQISGKAGEKKKIPLYQIIMDRYGDIVREFIH